MSLKSEHEGTEKCLTTNQGVPISDNQNSLKSGARGPTLLEDFIMREKITHFDHERIPERVVHAHGAGAHGYFYPTKNCSHLTKAKFLQEEGKKTEVFVRFSTVLGSKGSKDLARDVRGFATKFYTDEGNYDLVGNNIPVFFIQDAMKFPDVIHAGKNEPDRGFPEAATAHDTFWDFISLSPETMHMVMWAMSDRAIPRSFRMMEGFGVNTYRLVDEAGKSRLVKFHWRPVLGSASCVWDEAVKINGADSDFLRKDLWEAIETGNYPEYDFGVQVLDEKLLEKFQFDVLDATKVIPEELAPIEFIGRMVLDRNPTNDFAETEQVAFCVANVVPGIDFSNDPLLQGRIFSYLDTQLLRLGPNFAQLEVNRPRCPVMNYMKDGFHQMSLQKGRVKYEPNSAGVRHFTQCDRGFRTCPKAEGGETEGEKVRERPETFADHYSQARMFYHSLSIPEQRHIVNALAFELGQVETPTIVNKMLGHLMIIDPRLGQEVERELGLEGKAEKITPMREPIHLSLSPSLSLVKKAPNTLAGRKVGILVTDGVDDSLLQSVKSKIAAERAVPCVIGLRAGGAKTAAGEIVKVDKVLSSAPSVLFDAVVIIAAQPGQLLNLRAAAEFVGDAFFHFKAIAYTSGLEPLLKNAGLPQMEGEGLVKLDGDASMDEFIAKAKTQRIWSREDQLSSPDVRPPGVGQPR